MQTLRPIVQRLKGFTLFELLVVIAIIGIVYTVFVQKLQVSSRSEHVDTTNFTTFLAKQPYKEYLSFICLIDEIEKGCRLLLDGNMQDDFITFMAFKPFEEVRVYKVLGNGILDPILFAPVVIDGIYKDIFFRFDMNRYGGYKMLVMQKGERFYLYNSYDEVREFDDESEIKDYLWEQKKLLRDDL